MAREAKHRYQNLHQVKVATREGNPNLQQALEEVHFQLQVNQVMQEFFRILSSEGRLGNPGDFLHSQELKNHRQGERGLSVETGGSSNEAGPGKSISGNALTSFTTSFSFETGIVGISGTTGSLPSFGAVSGKEGFQ